MSDDPIASSVTPPSNIPSDHWAQAAFTVLAKRNLPGDGVDFALQADSPISRAAFIALLDQGLLDPTPQFLPSFFQWSAASTPKAPSFPSSNAAKTTITRAEGIALLVEQLHYLRPLVPDPLLEAYFDDGSQVSTEYKGAIAAATLGGLVVNYPDVRQLQPKAPLTWATAAALLCLGLGLRDTVPPQYVPWYATLATLGPEAAVPFWQLRGNAFLVRDIQTQLRKVHLYPRKQAPNGRFLLVTQMGLLEFCQILQLPNVQNYTLDATLAQALREVDIVDFSLKAAKNRDRIFREYYQQEKGYDASHLAFLDKGIQGSPFEKLVENYPTHLGLKHSKPAQPTSTLTQADVPQIPRRSLFGEAIIGSKARLFASDLASPSPPTTQSANYHALCLTPQPYPNRGVLPAIADDRLAFLHPDIQQACLCLGQFSQNQLQVNWLGRNALSTGELWSATKIIPLLNLVSQLHTKSLQSDIDNLVIRSGNRSQGFNVHDLAVDMVNYEYDISSSNALAAMFKLFSTPQSIETWLRTITGNTKLTFRGNYGEGPFIGSPVLWDKQLKKPVLKAADARHGGPNAISTYDLTRLITMLGWHTHLPASAQLPRAQWKSLESVIRAMGMDSARYVDVAIERLGLRQVIQSPVIASKMGFGYSGERRRTELVYSAFVQFADMRPKVANEGAPPIRTFGLTLLAAKRLGDGDREATLLDARIAAEVTEIIRRVMLEEWP
ncbi:MAG TPA: hypothetical protein V6D29_07045 [Leptolyngbyaceae cyanobacterium]